MEKFLPVSRSFWFEALGMSDPAKSWKPPLSAPENILLFTQKHSETQKVRRFTARKSQLLCSEETKGASEVLL